MVDLPHDHYYQIQIHTFGHAPLDVVYFISVIKTQRQKKYIPDHDNKIKIKIKMMKKRKGKETNAYWLLLFDFVIGLTVHVYEIVFVFFLFLCFCHWSQSFCLSMSVIIQNLIILVLKTMIIRFECVISIFESFKFGLIQI